MRILVLGGTAWLGREVARAGLAAGHSVTCLARGESGAVPDGARLVIGDRSDPAAYAGVAGQPWDLVVDVARQPGQVRTAMAALADRAEHWAFVSSASVYAVHEAQLRSESTALLPAYDGDVAPPEAYGEGKVACERLVLAALGDRALIARAGLLAGPGDPSDRVGYWPGRFALAGQDGGPVLVPERRDRACQLLDVRDLAGWLVDAGLRRVGGILNASGEVTTLGAVLDTAAAVAAYDGSTVAVGDEALQAAQVEEFMGPRSLPLWLADPQWAGFLSLDTTRAHAAGLTARPMADTLADALHWERELGLARTGRRAGLDRADELAVLGGAAGSTAS